MIATRKLFGVLMALAFALSMAAGAAAQTSDSEPVSAELVDSFCTVDLYTWSGSFGTWQYDSWWGGYFSTTGTTTSLYGYFWQQAYAGCNLQVDFAGLSGPGGLIDPSYFSAYSYNVGSVSPGSWNLSNVYYGFDFEYTLNYVPYVSPGLYTGNITTYVSNGA